MAADALDFMQNNATEVQSQIVVSESAASCFANQIAKSKLGRIELDRKRVNDFWGTGDQLTFDTSAMG